MSVDDSALLDLVGEVIGYLDIDEFRRGLLLALMAAMPSRWASLNDVSPTAVVAIAEPAAEAHWFEKFGELAHENPLYQHFRDTPDGRAMRFSDVATREELEATRLYREFYLPLGVKHQVAFTLPARRERVLAIALSRGDRDYSDAECDFLNRARPFLIQAYRNAIDHSTMARDASGHLPTALRAARLTPREVDVTRLVAVGRSNRDIATELELSERTVQKHLEHAFRKLGVTSRSQAAARAWELGSSIELTGDG